MIILSLTVVPFFTRARVYTAYEYLERRFDVRTRSLASLLFLVGRAFSLGVTLAAPAVVMSTILGWQLPVTVLAICVPMIIYTTIGGVQAVAWTDVKQMFIVVGGMTAAVFILVYGITREVSFGHALQLLILTSGVLVFVFYLFQTPPMLFNRTYDGQVAASPRAAEYTALEQDFDTAIALRRDAARRDAREAFLASDARVKDIRARAA